MRQATLLWSLWQRLPQPLVSISSSTRIGRRRLFQWVTALVLNLEEHTITQSVTAIERLDDCKAMVSLAEYGAWRADAVMRCPTPLIDTTPRPDRAWLPDLGRR